ncbi:MAG: hypothetical protein D6702_03405 [Planctomycetota bacterium]|nr:MAG: hypothetical protein D6702_03405 [Planctomycetota bacterium]
MPTLLARLVLVVGFCLATVGSAGFAEPVEDGAWGLLIAGLAATVAGGLALRALQRRRIAAGAAGGGLAPAGLAAALTEIQREVQSLAAAAAGLGPAELAARIDPILSGPCFELGSRNEAYARLLGAEAFARVWSGFAVAERLLARAWSMATDGFPEEARAELPRAEEAISAACREAAALAAPTGS